MFAGELLNWQSDGVAIETRIPFLVADTRVALQRIPFQFGAEEKYILLTDGLAVSGGASFARAFNGKAMAAALSSQIVIVDGLAEPLRFDGVSFLTATFTTGVPDVFAASFDGVIAHKSRLYFWKTNGPLEFYYGGVGSVQGELTRFPLGNLGNITGKMVTMASLSVDAGQNTNDVLAIFTSTGEIVVYGGSNPGDATDWAIITRVKAAPPLSRTGFAQVGSDVWMMTTSGVISVQQAINQGALALSGAITEPISTDILALVRAGPADWQLHVSANGALVIINRVDAAGARQFLYDTDSRSWFTSDYPAREWHNLGRNTEFTRFAPMNVGAELCRLDETGASTEEIAHRWVSSWFTLGRDGAIVALRPTILARGPLTVRIVVLADYNENLRDIAEAEQTVTLVPDDPADPNGIVSLNDVIATDAVGATFQLRIEVTARWAKIVSLRASIQ